MEAEQIRQMLLLGTKAKAKFYQEFLIRVSKGDKLSLTEKKMMDQLSKELAKELDDPTEPVVSEGLDPLTYMLRVMNDPKEDPAVRQMYRPRILSSRKGVVWGREERRAKGKAEAAGRGRFAPSKPPISLVK